MWGAMGSLEQRPEFALDPALPEFPLGPPAVSPGRPSEHCGWEPGAMGQARPEALTDYLLPNKVRKAQGSP